MPRRQRTDDFVQEVRKMRNKGLSARRIAELMFCGEATVWRAIRDGSIKNKEKVNA